MTLDKWISEVRGRLERSSGVAYLLNSKPTLSAKEDLTRALDEIERRVIDEIQWKSCYEGMQSQITQLQKQNEVLRETVEFYGDMDNWRGMDHVSPGPMFTDLCGVRARGALRRADEIGKSGGV